MKNLLSLTLFLCMLQPLFAQFPEEALKKKLKADLIEMDNGNGDGVFKARNKKTKKWGMYQWMYEGTQVNELIPMEYDSLRNIPFNGNFAAVYKDGKVGFYLSKWSYGEDAKQSVECLYTDYQRYDVEGITYLAVQKDGKWGWIDWYNGIEKSEFKYATKDALPYPYYKQEY